MSEISTNMVLDGITLALRASYPDSQIESNSIEQGLTPPAFIVHLVSSEQVARVGRRWKRLPRFDILYFPKKGREECYDVADELCGVLELITLPSDDLLRGTDMNFEVTDGVLHFLISYNHFVCHDETGDSMNNIEIKQGG